LLVRRLRDEGEMNSSVAAAGEVTVEGEHLGRIEGFRFVPDATEGQTDQKAVLTAALRALRQDLPARLQVFTNSTDGEIVFDAQLRVCWGGGPVARLLPSGDVLAPRVEALASDLLDGPAREEVRKRAATWVETRIRLGLSELMDARATTELPAGARGIVFQLCEGLGVLPRRPIEDQLAQLSEDDRKALARLGVRVGIYSLYFPSMLKPVPIRLRAGLWMVAKNRDTIPLLPAEGRTSMDLPRDAVRDFYAAIGYLPLGDHAIRADMVERLAAMARHAVRDSRDAARRAQQQQRETRPADGQVAAAATPLADEISEWAIVAAAFGENEPLARGTLEAAEAPATEAPATAAVAETVSEPAGEEAKAADQAPIAEAPPTEAAAADATPDEATAAEESSIEHDGMEPASEQVAGEAPKEEPREEPKATPRRELRPLPPGHFRATPQMMSLVGCSEPEMANVLRALGYRVHPPSEENGPLHSFSIKPRFVREREEQRERQRQQHRQHRDQRRRERPERPNERQFFADSPRPDRNKDERPRKDGPRPERGQERSRDKDERQRDDRPRGPRPPRRDGGGPALRLYATTEKKGDAPAADSPFAKLLELKLGGKK
jgi:ATP-dependent RNA helicase SUPV3L1/SUV3